MNVSSVCGEPIAAAWSRVGGDCAALGSLEALHSHEWREWGVRHRHDQETKDRTVRMFEERREEHPHESRKQALIHLSDLIGAPLDTVRGWVDRARVDAGEKPGVTSSEREEIRALRKELAE